MSGSFANITRLTSVVTRTPFILRYHVFVTVLFFFFADASLLPVEFAELRTLAWVGGFVGFVFATEQLPWPPFSSGLVPRRKFCDCETTGAIPLSVFWHHVC